MSNQHTHVEQITEPKHTYKIHMGGTLDEFNTFQYGRRVSCKFQPNISLTIENVGDSVIRGPRLVVNGRRNWYSIGHILDGIMSPEMTDEEKTFAVWNFVRNNLQEGHTYNSIVWGEDGSITRFLNAVGTGACGTFHGVTPLLLARAGVQSMCGYVSFGAHAAQKDCYDGTDHYFDAMLSTHDRSQPRGHFPLELDNETVAGVDDVLKDRYLIDRCGIGPLHFRNVAYFGRDCNFWHLPYDDPHTMSWHLRPGERVTFTWEDCQKTWASAPLDPQSGNGNGTVSYTPKEMPDDGIIEMRSPYPIVGAEVEGRFVGDGSIDASFDSQTWENIWKGTGAATVNLPEERPEFKEPIYSDRIWFRFNGLSTPPEITVWFQTYLRSLPSLSVGENNVVYEDDTKGERKVRITHCWRKSSAAIPRKPSPGPITGTETAGIFRWREPEEAGKPAAWEFFLSPREDLSRPLMACFHVVVEGGPEYTVQDFGAFSPGRKYHWRVRPCSVEGVWGPWSDTWDFTADVPPSPFHLRVDSDGEGKILLRWKYPGEIGDNIQFEVYGDGEDGFTPRLEDRTGIGENRPDAPMFALPANRLAVTRDLQLEITALPAAFFRVVTVDGKGARSTPSRCVAAPHPKVLPLPVPPATAGSEYRAQLPVRTNTGRWIVNIRPDLPKGIVRVGADRLRFAMVHSPKWLSIAPESGEIFGVPTAEDVGVQDFFVEVMEGNGRGHSTRMFVEVRPAG